jgi:hypothetical protein
MAEVFISFIHEEVDYAECVGVFINQVLTPTVMPFMSSDKLQVYAGEKWLDRIMSELASAKVVILMLSKRSVGRPWVNFEAGAAWTRDIVAIPVCFGELTKEQLPKPYSSLQAVDLESRDDHEYLAKSVAHHLRIPEPVKRYFGVAPSTLATILGGGRELEIQIQREEAAYVRFEERLGELQDPTRLSSLPPPPSIS